jgi:hypothetical protein
MSLLKSNLIQEIRINPKYTQYLLSEFPGDGVGSMKDEAKPIIMKRTLFTSDYMKKLSGSAERGILPPNCRYIEPTSKGHIVVIEEPPALRTIKIQKGFENEVHELRKNEQLEESGYKKFDASGQSPIRFTLAFPYVIFILVIEQDKQLIDGLVFLRTQEMRGMSDYLLKAPLLNISNNQRVCFGDANKFNTFSLTQTIQNVIMVFWSAIFNTDYTYNYTSYQKEESEFGNYLRWEYLTRQNPLFIYDAKWIQMTGNLGYWLDKVKGDAHVIGQQSLSYSKAAEMIFAPVKSDLEAGLTSRSKKKLPLFYDIANGIYIGDYFLSIGDPFTNSRGEVLFIDSFIGFEDGGQLKFMMVDKNGKKFMMKLTRRVKDYIAFSNKALRYANEMVLPNNNLKVKTGDILIFTNKDGSEHYGSLDFIRLGRDGRAELKVGRDYYIAENINATKFEMETPSVYNIELKNDEVYILIRDLRGSCPMMSASKVKYKKVRVTGSSKIDFEFENIIPLLRGNKHHLPMSKEPFSSSSARLFRESDVKPLSGVFRIGKKMYFLSTNSDRTTISREALAWEIPGTALAYENNCSLRRPRHGMIAGLVKKDKFRLPGFLLDLEFSIGDKVVAADWKNPHDILRVKEIAGFSVVDRDSSMARCEDLYFILSDKDGTLSKVKYIYGYSGICHIGKIRKITNVFNRVSAGTKIIAEAAGYSGFPKKDINIIIGFIIDTGGEEPLVLCSNGQTIWFGDMMKDFTRVTMRSKKWATLKHAPIDLSKIKPQAGDLINGTKNYKASEGYLITHLPSNYRGIRAQFMEYYTGYPETRAMDSSFAREYIYECIPNPRVRPSQVDHLGTLPGFPNFHGLFHYSEKSNYHFINEPGRFLNVQSSSK